MVNKLKIFSAVTFVSLLYCSIFGMLFGSFQEAATVSSDVSDNVSVPIITYYSVLKDTELSGKYIITPETLEADIEYLKDNGYEFVSAQDLIDYSNNNGFLPEKPILLTFDDGFYNSYSYVMPILEKCGARGVVSVIGRYTDEYSQSKIVDMTHGYLRWSEVYDMFLSSRTEIANHSYDLTSEQNFYEDTKKAQDRFLTKTGFAPVIYTYPADADSEETTDILKEMGFRMSLTSSEGTNVISKNPDTLFMLKRYTRTSDVTAENFFNGILQ